MALTNKQKQQIARKAYADEAAGKPAPTWSRHSSSPNSPERGVQVVVGPQVPRR